MREGLAICREHGQAPSWWDALDRQERVILVADRRLRIEEASRG